MTVADASPRGLWWRWVVANAVAELLGLGIVASCGFLVARYFGERHGVAASLAMASLFVALGAIEGLVVGVAQASVLRQYLPGLRGWVGATVVGAVVAWIIGVAPSTIMRIMSRAIDSSATPPPDIGEPVRLLMAAGLGLVAGPLLAFFQWRRLRLAVRDGAAWWLVANGAAWAVGMPVIFVGAHVAAFTSDPLLIGLGVALALVLAGAAVGAVHGRFLVWLLGARRPAAGSGGTA